jgi:hypothetical protein
MKGTSLTLLIATVFALGACGGGDNSNDNASNTTSGGTTATTGGTGASGGSKSTTKTQTTTTERKRSRKGKGKNGSGKSGGGSRTQSETTTTTETPTTTTPTTPGQIPKPYDTAKKVCGAFLPLQVQRDLKRGKRSEKSVARQYSRAWPEDQKKSAYKGCLAGLKARK